MTAFESRCLGLCQTFHLPGFFLRICGVPKPSTSARCCGDNTSAIVPIHMVYVEKGHVVQQQSVWSVKAFVGTFWAIINGIVFFWETLVSPSAAAKYKDRLSTKKRSDRKQDSKRGGSNGPRITGLSNLRDNSNPPAGAGGC